MLKTLGQIVAFSSLLALASAADIEVTFETGAKVRLTNARIVRQSAGLPTAPKAAPPTSSLLKKLPLDPDPQWVVPFGVDGYWGTLPLGTEFEMWVREDFGAKVADVTLASGSRITGAIFDNGGAWPPLPTIRVAGFIRTFNQRKAHGVYLRDVAHMKKTAAGICSISSRVSAPVELVDCRLEYQHEATSTTGDLLLSLDVNGERVQVPIEEVTKVTFEDASGSSVPVRAWLRSGQVVRGFAPGAGAVRGYTPEGWFIYTNIIHRNFAVVKEIAFR